MRDSDTIRTVSTVLDGQLGVSDVALSLPTIIGSSGAKKVLIPNLTEQELALFQKSADACKAVLESCK